MSPRSIAFNFSSITKSPFQPYHRCPVLTLLGFAKNRLVKINGFFFRATSTIDRGARFAMRRARLDRAVSKTSYARHGLPVGHGRVAVAWRQTIFTYRHGVIVSNGRYFDYTCLMWFSSTGTLNKQSITTI